MSRRNLPIVLFFVALVAIFFAPLLFGGRVLVPFDNLFRFPPWSAFASQFGITIPQNELVSDLVLENYAWKKFIVESLRARELPLWNPYLFAGVPFLAAGQHSFLYPFSILFYILPIDRVYGYFIALQFVIGALAMFAFGRVLGLSRFAAALSALVYVFSGFMIVSIAFPMVISAAIWLPAVLACVERIFREGKQTPRNTARQILFAFVGAIVLGVQFLAGHIEISLYVLMVTAFYAVWRAVSLPRVEGAGRRVRFAWRDLFMSGAMTVVGIALGGVQLAPLYEVVQRNFRSGSAAYQDVIGYAYPLRQMITFLIPDFYGNPTHHSYLDVFDFTTRAAPFSTIFWGIKNYVEAGAYVGILPLLLAIIAIVSSFKPTFRETCNLKPVTILFTTLALLSLLFTFGTPLYAILFYGVPGFNQLHTPFRWIFPYTLSMAVLAGIGVDVIARSAKRDEAITPLPFPPLAKGRVGWGRRLLRFARNDTFAWLAIALGTAILIALGATWIARDQTLAIAGRIVQSSDLARAAFHTGRMFYSYEFRNVFLFAIFLIGAGIVLRVSHSARQIRRVPIWQPLAVGMTVLDLFIVGMGFYPATDPRLAEFTPPAIKFLQQDQSLYRVTSYDERGGPEEKVFNANVGMFYDIADIRGYDSIIPKQYADLMGLLAPQDELLSNRIAPFYNPDPFDSPILNLLNVKYVLTTRALPNAGYTLVYDAEIKIYRNERVLPRAFMVPQARVIPDPDALLAEMKHFDPAHEVLLEQAPELKIQETNAASCPFKPVWVDKYSSAQVAIKSDQICAGWLVLSDSYFPGWMAQVDDVDAQLFKADYNFRAVFVPAGAHTVRFKYSPLSFRVGIIASWLGAMVLVLTGAYLLWRRFYRADESSPVRVVAKNSLLPMATSLLMKVLNLAFAFLSLRVLGPTGTGRYAFAVTLWFFADTITDFGLGILLTREVSRDRSQANRYLINASILRVILWVFSLIPIGMVAAIYVNFFNLTLDTAAALGLLMISVLPGTLAASLAFLFNAYERFEYRIVVDFAMRLVSVALGVVALLLGYGFIGLAVVSIITNLMTLTSFYYLVRTRLFVPRLQVNRELIRWMLFESYPLMFNNLLSSLFFRIDVLILQPLQGDTVLGYYNTAYKFIDALNFIPSNFTLAIFPALARFAASAKDSMLRAYILSLKILLWIALPITIGTIFVAHDLIQIFGGDAYLPHSAIALQVLIWFLPFSFINSVTHYVLIALGQQRFLTKAFIIGVLFNVLANLAVIPLLSYVGASLVTILSEIVLLIPFYFGVRKNLASIPFWSIAWRPALAAGVMGIALGEMTARLGLIAAIPLSGIIYAVLLVLLGALGEDERAMVRRLLPARLKPGKANGV